MIKNLVTTVFGQKRDDFEYAAVCSTFLVYFMWNFELFYTFSKKSYVQHCPAKKIIYDIFFESIFSTLELDFFSQWKKIKEIPCWHFGGSFAFPYRFKSLRSSSGPFWRIYVQYHGTHVTHNGCKDKNTNQEVCFLETYF